MQIKGNPHQLERDRLLLAANLPEVKHVAPKPRLPAANAQHATLGTWRLLWEALMQVNLLRCNVASIELSLSARKASYGGNFLQPGDDRVRKHMLPP